MLKNVVKKYLETQTFKVITHPNYSPDLALCDFDLKVTYKQRLSNHFDCERLNDQITVMVSEIPEFVMVSEIPEFEYRKDLNKWIEIMQAEMCNRKSCLYFDYDYDWYETTSNLM
jgi:hypothetical protein